MKQLSVLLVAVALLLSSAALAGQPKVTVCHRPPGNPAMSQIISLAAPAVPAHLAHGDNVVSDEVCDGIDNNCDGRVDEDNVCGYCGDGTCTPPEDPNSCPSDCAISGDQNCPNCGDGTCDAAEVSCCPSDCTCAGVCNATPNGGGCFCDTDCSTYGDCCSDVCNACPAVCSP